MWVVTTNEWGRSFVKLKRYIWFNCQRNMFIVYFQGNNHSRTIFYFEITYLNTKARDQKNNWLFLWRSQFAVFCTQCDDFIKGLNVLCWWNSNEFHCIQEKSLGAVHGSSSNWFNDLFPRFIEEFYILPRNSKGNLSSIYNWVLLRPSV